MTESENIPEIHYKELKHPECPICKDKLIMDDIGCWYCETFECGYSEYNNINRCQSDWCDNLVLSKDFDFYEMEENYCQIEIDCGTCLSQAIGEGEQERAENDALEEHMKHCNSDTCDCRNV